MADNTTPTPFSLSWFASKDDLIAAQAARITELEAELEAVGAGGVQSLRSPLKTAEGAATQIKPTHSKHPFFSYDPDVGFETHKTEQEAQQAAKESIAQYRVIADETWPAEATEVYYGLILGESCEIDSGVVNDEGNRCVEFELRPVQAAPQPQVEPAEAYDYKAWYEEAMVASNEAGYVGFDAAQTIRALAALATTQPATVTQQLTAEQPAPVSPRSHFIKGWDAARMYLGMPGSADSDAAMRRYMALLACSQYQLEQDLQAQNNSENPSEYFRHRAQL